MNVTCTGCATHGFCIDQETMRELHDKMPYSDAAAEASPAQETQVKANIDFEKEMEALQKLQTTNVAADNARLDTLAKFIMSNSEANSPASLRAALQLQVSNAFAAWSDETAQSELQFCNTSLLKRV